MQPSNASNASNVTCVNNIPDSQCAGAVLILLLYGVEWERQDQSACIAVDAKASDWKCDMLTIS